MDNCWCNLEFGNSSIIDWYIILIDKMRALLEVERNYTTKIKEMIYMTVAENMVKELVEKKIMMQSLHEEMSEIESNFDGMEIDYKGQWAMVNFIDGNSQKVNLYVENSDGNSEHVDLSFGEFQKVLSE
ncbi:MAG: hypothetical protein WD512_20455 [Candidatus Paceibacterota bacterium]